MKTYKQKGNDMLLMLKHKTSFKVFINRAVLMVAPKEKSKIFHDFLSCNLSTTTVAKLLEYRGTGTLIFNSANSKVEFGF